MEESCVVDQGGPFTHTSQMLQFAVSAVLKGNTAPRLLDLRCGIGRLADIFAQHGWEVCGLDPSAHFAKAWETIADNHAHCRFVKTDVFSRPPDGLGSFDLVVAFDDSAIELLDPETLSSTLSFVTQSLRPGGYFIFQIERSTAKGFDRETIAALSQNNFDAWRASPASPRTRILCDVAHVGSRDMFVAHKSIEWDCPRFSSWR